MLSFVSKAHVQLAWRVAFFIFYKIAHLDCQGLKGGRRIGVDCGHNV